MKEFKINSKPNSGFFYSVLFLILFFLQIDLPSLIEVKYICKKSNGIGWKGGLQ